MDPSVYLFVRRRYSGFAPEAYCPLYKVSVPDSSLPGASATTREESHRQIAAVEVDLEGMSFVSLPSSGWIIGVGGVPGGTIIIDDTEPPTKVIRGPNLLAAKRYPILAAVGDKVYALCISPSYKTEPDFVPWFEVLDLSKGTVTEAADGSLRLDGCSWEELAWPSCFPRRLSPTDYLHPPIISVRAYVVVPPYVLLSINPQTPSCTTYAFDTNSGEWHTINNSSLPFLGPAVPHYGPRGCCVFLGSSQEDGRVYAYQIRVSTSSSTTKAGVVSAGKGSALGLSITEWSIRNKEHERVGNHRKYKMIASYTYSKKLFVKLTTYHIENNPAFLEETQGQRNLLTVKHEIQVSKQQEQDFEFFSSYGFSPPEIRLALSI
ncbi:hypothetical protein HU200_019055 [Digitaria exilis]|uniref:Uncharacterized protein n=1 Tax=Digitaria exilis TaxID=1010633 RepID=A0A835KFC8_9POAL|nr:hypothetical protein HU200_019055 [Digitaria exilis]